MSERKRPDTSRLGKARRRYRVELPPRGTRRRYPNCGTEAAVKGAGGGWLAFCPYCRQIIGAQDDRRT